ncbi:MAG: uroporphyrinogen-III synthase [Bacteroidota bacterium]|nr:uroporphyrinogen-III synthase [Bacteroidota bacterium]
METRQTKVKSILISQPKPEGKSPYMQIQRKYKLKIDYRPFIQVEEITALEFKKQRISILNHDAVIFSSKHAMDHYFGMCEKMRIRVPDAMKYFCVSEVIAHYLQNFITYRKRKIFIGEQTFASLIPLMQKHNESKFLFPCSDILKKRINKSMDDSGLEYTKAEMYRVICSDLTDLKSVSYDILVFFSPTDIKSLYENFPKFQQNNTRIAVFGPSTLQSVKDHNLIADIIVPNKNAPSMSMALDQYIREANKRRRK